MRTKRTLQHGKNMYTVEISIYQIQKALPSSYEMQKSSAFNVLHAQAM